MTAKPSCGSRRSSRAPNSARLPSRCACRRCHLSLFVPHAHQRPPLRRVRSQAKLEERHAHDDARHEALAGMLSALCAQAGLPTIARSNAVLRPLRDAPSEPASSELRKSPRPPVTRAGRAGLAVSPPPPGAGLGMSPPPPGANL